MSLNSPLVSASGTLSSGVGTTVAVPTRKPGRRAAARMGLVRSIVVPLILLGLWELLSATGVVSVLFLPGPLAVLRAFGSQLSSGALMSNLAPTLERYFEGFALSCLFAIPVGLLCGVSRLVRNYINAALELLRPIPPIALIPVLILWLGIGNASKVAIVAYGAFWPIWLNTLMGVQETPPLLRRAARVMGIQGIRYFTKVAFPAALPKIIAGVRISASIALIVVIAAEMVEATNGIGYAIVTAERTFQTADMLAYIVLISLVGYAVNAALRLFETRVYRARGLGERRPDVICD